MDKTVYQMLINNTAEYIRSEENRKAVLRNEGLDAFTCSMVLGIALCKDKEKILVDLAKAQTT